MILHLIDNAFQLTTKITLINDKNKPSKCLTSYSQAKVKANQVKLKLYFINYYI